MSPRLEASAIPSLDDLRFVMEILEALQRIYGELTYEPRLAVGDRPSLFGDGSSHEMRERLLAFIEAMRRVCPHPNVAVGYLGLALSIHVFDAYRAQHVIDSVDRDLKRHEAVVAERLCHTEEDACSIECAATAELYARILLVRSSLMLVSGLSDLIRARALKSRLLVTCA